MCQNKGGLALSIDGTKTHQYTAVAEGSLACFPACAAAPKLAAARPYFASARPALTDTLEADRASSLAALASCHHPTLPNVLVNSCQKTVVKKQFTQMDGGPGLTTTFCVGGEYDRSSGQPVLVGNRGMLRDIVISLYRARR